MVTKFTLVLDHVTYEVERKGDLILVNGLEFPFSANGKLISIGGNSHSVELHGTTANVDGIVYTIDAQGLEEPNSSRLHRAKSGQPAEEAGTITAIMPGLIISVNKREGDHVDAGEVVIVLEAMKMQNELQAKRAGVVKLIAVERGDTVEMRQVLAVID